MATRRDSLPAGAPVDVLVALVTDGGDTAADHRMLADLAARLAPRDPAHPAPCVVAHRCESCGSPEHGRPVLVTAEGTVVRGVHLSLSRAGGRVALAATRTAALGVDIESLNATRSAAFDDVAFDDHERAALRALAQSNGDATADRMRALAWTAKEAALKAAGTGLRADPREVRLELSGPDLRIRPRDATKLALLPLPDLPSELVGMIAVHTGAPVRIHYSFGSDFP